MSEHNSEFYKKFVLQLKIEGKRKKVTFLSAEPLDKIINTYCQVWHDSFLYLMTAYPARHTFDDQFWFLSGEALKIFGEYIEYLDNQYGAKEGVFADLFQEFRKRVRKNGVEIQFDQANLRGEIFFDGFRWFHYKRK